MGGLVNTSIRFQNGNVINTLIYTHLLHNIFASKAFYDRDESLINKICKKYTYNTWEGEIFESLAPYQYGLVVADFQSNTILDMQSYCNIGKLTIPSLDFGHKTMAKFFKSEDYLISDLKLSVDLLMEKRILYYTYCDKKYKSFTQHIEKDYNTFEEAYLYLKLLKQSRYMAQFIYNTGCEITRINQSDSVQFFTQLQSMGYIFNEQDEINFENWYNDKNY